MYSITGTTIRLTRGDTLVVDVGIKNPDGTAYEVQSGDSIRFALKRALMTGGNKDFADKDPIITKAIPTNTLTLALAPTDTEDLAFGKYKYDIEITFANGQVCTFIPDADFIITPEID